MRQTSLTIVASRLLVASVATAPHAGGQNLDNPRSHYSKGSSSMSRIQPAKIAPIVIGDIQYGESNGYNNNSLHIIDTRSGKEINKIDIYHYPVDPNKEADVQEVYFKSMSLTPDNKYIVIENERGHRFLFNIKDQKSQELNHPCDLRLIEAKKIGSKWKVLVELSTTNLHPSEDFYLDRFSFGESYRLMNNLFEIKSGLSTIHYQGMMKERSYPEDFTRIKPGESHEVTIEIGEEYAFPPEGGTFSIQYRTHNHFSPNNVDLVSNVISVELIP